MNKVRGKFIDVDDLELNLSITMTLKEWKELKEIIDDDKIFTGRYKVVNAIRKAVFNAEKQIHEEI